MFHTNRHELHGITVAIRTTGARTWVGRFHEQDEKGVHLLDAALHDPAVADGSREDFLRRALKFGFRAEQKHVLLPAAEIAEITRFGELRVE